ncbi:DUF2346 domain-containing protein [Acinetobacter baumannii]|nr:DUF2346 domain-containing protein [Acinetobacter baumannii]
MFRFWLYISFPIIKFFYFNKEK